MVKYILAYVLSCSLFCYFSYDYFLGKGNLELAKFKQQVSQEAYAEVVHLQDTINKNERSKQDEIASINKRHSVIVNSLRDRPNRTPEATSSTVIDTGTGSTGQQLFREDAEFLIGEAAKAMILKESLTTCRRYLLEITQ